MTQADAVDLHTTFCGIDERRGRTLKALYRRSRIRTRHSVLFESSEGPVEGRQPFYRPARDDEDPGPTTAERAPIVAYSTKRVSWMSRARKTGFGLPT